MLHFGGGRGGGKLRENCPKALFSLGAFHDNKIWKFCKFDCRREFKGTHDRGNRTESLWEGNLPLRGSLRGRVSKAFRGFQRFSEVLRGVFRGFQRSSQRPSQGQIPVAPHRVAPWAFSKIVWNFVVIWFSEAPRQAPWTLWMQVATEKLIGTKLFNDCWIPCNPSDTIPTEKRHAHAFVLGPELCQPAFFPCLDQGIGKTTIPKIMKKGPKIPKSDW